VVPPQTPDAETALEAPAEFDRYADVYERELQEGLRWSGEHSEYFTRGRLGALASRLRELGQRPDVMLDFGCGTGSTTPLLISLVGASHVIGVDVSPRLLAVASAEHASASIEFQVRGQRLARAVDTAYCNGVFHHIAPDQRDEAVAYVFSSLRPGGLFALFENNPWNPGTRLVMRSIPFDRDANPLTASEACRLLRRGGFEVITTDFMFVFPHVLGPLRRWEKPLQRLPLGAQYMVLGRKPVSKSVAG
jgi:SAM-dependent methyltransferase